MRTIHIKKYLYKGDLAEIDTDIEFILSDEDFEKYNNSVCIAELDARISANWIEILEKRAAFEYFRQNYTKAFEGKYQPQAWEIRSIISLWSVSRTQAASCLGIDKTTLSNQISGKRNMERSTAFLLLERLGQELSRPGAVKAMVDTDSPKPSHSTQFEERIEQLRYHRAA
ncbi:MAG: hypothetical protein V4591_04630 [Bdellovibrionota bacterium]